MLGIRWVFIHPQCSLCLERLNDRLCHTYMNLDFSYRVSQIKAESAIPTQRMSREFQESTTLVLSEPVSVSQPWGPSHSAVRISIKSLARPHVCEEASRLSQKHIKRTHIFLFDIFPPSQALAQVTTPFVYSGNVPLASVSIYLSQYSTRY